MILFSILLAAGLDLSLPEFEPDDVSGNYIVSEYDVSGDEFIAVEVPASELSESVALRTEATTEAQDVVDAINSLNEDNNSYWELFLDSYPVSQDHVVLLESASLFQYNTSGQVLAPNSSTHNLYAPVSAGVTYTIKDLPSIAYNRYNFGVVNSLELSEITTVTNYVRRSDKDNSDFTFTASQDGYFVAYVNYSSPLNGGSLNWTIIEQESYTLSELGNAVMEIRSNNDMKFRILIFLTFLNFAYPIVISSFKNFFGGGKNV